MHLSFFQKCRNKTGFSLRIYDLKTKSFRSLFPHLQNKAKKSTVIMASCIKIGFLVGGDVRDYCKNYFLEIHFHLNRTNRKRNNAWPLVYYIILPFPLKWKARFFEGSAYEGWLGAILF